MFLRPGVESGDKAKLDESLRAIIENIDKSILNMVEFYRDTLMGFLEGQASLNEIPRGNRKRFVESGVLRRFGSRYEITEVGEILIRRTHALI